MIYLGADHRGYKLKEELKGWLVSRGCDVTDLGNDKYDRDDDFVDFAIRLGQRVVRDGQRGVLVCGSGVGMAVAANKVGGVRAGVLTSGRQARIAREEDDINIACLGADFMTTEEAKEVVEIFVETLFLSEERYVKRIQKIKNYEKKCCQN